MNAAARIGPPLGVTALVAAIVAGHVVEIGRATHGSFAYALDDAYIHLAIAEHFVEDGVWGVTSAAFTSASSSPLWTFLLAALGALFGVGERLPLALGSCAVPLALGAAHAAIAGPTMPPLRAGLLLVVWALVVPLPYLVLTGMEHGLHVAVSLAYAAAAARVLAGRLPIGSAAAGALLALAPLQIATRYEGVFLVAVVGALLLWRRSVALAVATGALAALPAAAYAAWAVGHGWYALPTSVLLKAQVGELTSPLDVLAMIGGRGLEPLLAAPQVGFPLLAVLVLVAWRLGREPLWSEPIVLGVVAAAVTALHMAYATWGWYRYEAWLVALLAAAALRLVPLDAVAAVDRVGPRFVAIGAAAAITTWPLLDRARDAIVETAGRCADIWEQQIQMARFVGRYYPNDAIALNDIGAVAYFTDARLLDLWGLGSLDVAQARRRGSYDTAAIDRLARSHGVRIAMVYDDWFRPIGLPAGWVRVGAWSVDETLAAAKPDVTFYAVDPAEADALRAHLAEFRAELPPSVTAVAP